MGKSRNPVQFTKKEAVKRLQAAKDFLGNKERIGYMRNNVVYVPHGYDPDCDSSYYAAPRLEAASIDSIVSSTLSLVSCSWDSDVRFKRSHASEFVGWCFRDGIGIGETVSLVFYAWRRPEYSPIAHLEARKFATLWLGTWHHAPLIAWKSSSEAMVDFLPQYIDLIH